MLEQQKKEREMRKKKEEDNNLTLEQTKEQVNLYTTSHGVCILKFNFSYLQILFDASSADIILAKGEFGNNQQYLHLSQCLQLY